MYAIILISMALQDVQISHNILLFQMLFLHFIDFSRFCYFTIFSAGNVAEYNQCVWGQYQVDNFCQQGFNADWFVKARSARVAETPSVNSEPTLPIVCLN